MIDPLIESLRGLSSAAEEALESLESNDYRKEAKHFKDEELPLRMMPKTIKEIFNSVMRYCIPIIGDDDPLPEYALLNSDNMEIFTENLNATSNWECSHRFSFIHIDPIEEVAAEFNEIGLHTQARLLENVCSFARAIRQSGNKSPFAHSSAEQAPVNYIISLAPEELSDKEKHDDLLFDQFSSVFAKNSYSHQQRFALYNALQKLVSDPSEKKPHLVVMAVIVLLRTRRAFKNPIPGSLNSCRDNIFRSLGLDPAKCHSYGDSSLSKDASPSLLKYKDKANDILKTAFGNTR